MLHKKDQVYYNTGVSGTYDLRYYGNSHFLKRDFGILIKIISVFQTFRGDGKM